MKSEKATKESIYKYIYLKRNLLIFQFLNLLRETRLHIFICFFLCRDDMQFILWFPRRFKLPNVFHLFIEQEQHNIQQCM